MKRLIISLLITALMFSGSAASIFATEDDHIHDWSSWETNQESTCSTIGEELSELVKTKIATQFIIAKTADASITESKRPEKS